MRLKEKIDVVNAQIVNTSLGIESHGIFTFSITLKFERGNIAFGNIALDEWDEIQEKRTGTRLGMDIIMRLLEVVGVDTWEELKGRYIRINEVRLGSGVKLIGNLIKDDWFYLDDILKNFKLDEVKGVD